MGIKFTENEKEMDKFMLGIQTKMVTAVEEKAKKLVPVKTGALKSSISKKNVGKNKWQVFANTSYATFVELGTSKMRAQPYLRPAINALRRFTR